MDVHSSTHLSPTMIIDSGLLPCAAHTSSSMKGEGLPVMMGATSGLTAWCRVGRRVGVGVGLKGGVEGC